MTPHKLFLAASCWAITAHAQVRDGTVAAEPSVFIEVQADGQHCVVRKVAVLCSDVLTHLREVLRLPPGTWIRFKAGRVTPYEAIRKLMDDVQHSEYVTSAAYLPTPKDGSR
jgi:biopolymer transport protein ExbD